MTEKFIEQKRKKWPVNVKVRKCDRLKKRNYNTVKNGSKYSA